MVELYKIHHRIGRSMPTGTYEITRFGTRRAITKFQEIYSTDLGEFTTEKWKEELSKAITADKEDDVLEEIINHCRKNCAWLHNENDIKEYAMDILAGRVFLCGNECWNDVADKVRSKYIIFTFSGGESNAKENFQSGKTRSIQEI